jgi:hypothetical protein
VTVKDLLTVNLCNKLPMYVIAKIFLYIYFYIKLRNRPLCDGMPRWMESVASCHDARRHLVRDIHTSWFSRYKEWSSELLWRGWLNRRWNATPSATCGTYTQNVHRLWCNFHAATPQASQKRGHNGFFPDAFPIKVLAYADDWLIFPSAPNEWETLTHHLQIYHLACNAKVNLAKTILFPIAGKASIPWQTLVRQKLLNWHDSSNPAPTNYLQSGTLRINLTSFCSLWRQN